MRLWTALSALAVTLIAGVWVTADSSQEPSLELIMERKLDHAHGVLEALIFEDYESLADSADALVALSHEASWFVLRTPEYEQKSAGFRDAAGEIAAAARERSLEGAALGYVDMTLKCVQCHELLRGSRLAGSFDPGLRRIPQGRASR